MNIEIWSRFKTSFGDLKKVANEVHTHIEGPCLEPGKVARQCGRQNSEMGVPYEVPQLKKNYKKTHETEVNKEVI